MEVTITHSSAAACLQLTVSVGCFARCEHSEHARSDLSGMMLQCASQLCALYPASLPPPLSISILPAQTPLSACHS
eukprot:1160938-Pelagomonas_calceolata.AAC.16